MQTLLIQNIQGIMLLSALMVALYFDLTQHRIPNLLTYGTAIAGIILQCLLGGWAGLLEGIGGLGVGLLVFLPFFLGGGMGAGDIKLMAALGVMLGPYETLLTAGVTLVAGSLFGVMILVAKRGVKKHFSRYCLMLKHFFYTGKPMYLPPANGDVATMVFPYATAIACGYGVTLWWTL